IAAGARLANPGEFTLRAFINGRIDLTQAEAVADVIQSRSEASLRLAVNQLGGRLSAHVDRARKQVLSIVALLEANIDFSEDDVPPADAGTLIAGLASARRDLAKLLEAADDGILYRRGARVAIVGQPNAGKSSLLNALLRGDRAIVTPVPGTTRDTIEESVSLGGLPVTLVDTAGITETADPVERIGVSRSRAAIESADLVLLVYDATAGWATGDQEILDGLASRQRLVVANKADLLPGGYGARPELPPGGARSRNATGTVATDPPLVTPVSALTREGLGNLEQALRERLLKTAVAGVDDILVNNLRHKTLLERAALHLEEAAASVEEGKPADFVCIDLRGALSALGTITGSEVSESILDEIFSRFCIGK
ncbi:MAG: tRNA uridine-5-carboxymethylaminomethyl(34) synthesis GTPase MnmE, partial [Chloroflexota bacterium]